MSQPEIQAVEAEERGRTEEKPTPPNLVGWGIYRREVRGKGAMVWEGRFQG